jgi:hypothetical protein
MVKPDVIVKIRLLTEKEGGRTEPLLRGAGSQYRTMAVIPGDGQIYRSRQSSSHDFCMLLDGEGLINPGEEAVVPMVFLCPEFVLPLLSVGAKLDIYEARKVGEAEILSFCENGTCTHG